MRPALVALLLISLVPGCGAEDPYPLRPPGGGSGTGSNAPDAGTIDAGLADAAVGQLDGRVCVIRDVANPFECPVDLAAEAVRIATRIAGTTTASDRNGDFTIDMTEAIDILEVGGDVADGLLTTATYSNLTGPPVDALALDEIAAQAILDSLGETQSTGAMLVYVRDSLGPVPGASLAGPGRIYYDDGAGGFLPDAVVTGDDGIVLLIDVSNATVTATEGVRSANTAVATLNGGFGIAIVTLPDPP